MPEASGAGRRRLALSQFTTSSLSFADDLALLRATGIDGLELCELKLPENSAAADDQVRALRDSGVSVCSVQARVHSVFPDQMSPEPASPAARRDALRRTMDRLRAWLPEAHPTFVLISGRAPDHDLGRARAELLTTAAALAADAAERGCRVAFEPLNPVMMNVDSFLWLWDDALALVRSVGRDNFGLVCDVWNVWQEPGILERVAGSIDHVFLVHASDWRDGGPRRLNDRLIPGRGVIPFRSWGDMLARVNYRGWIAIEMLSDRELEDSYLHRDPAAVINESRCHLEASGWCATA